MGSRHRSFRPIVNGETHVCVSTVRTCCSASNTAPAVAVTLHELATNAAKYGALSTPDGHVQIAWSPRADGRLVLSWVETGGPPVTPPTRRGFGTRAMDGLIRSQLNGHMRFDWRAEGLACEIILPLPPNSGAAD